MVPENPPAFPSIETHPSYDMPMHHFGMSLRDYFAGQALAGLLASPFDGPPGSEEQHGAHFARMSFIYADAMLAERAK